MPRRASCRLLASQRAVSTRLHERPESRRDTREKGQAGRASGCTTVPLNTHTEQTSLPSNSWFDGRIALGMSPIRAPINELRAAIYPKRQRDALARAARRAPSGAGPAACAGRCSCCSACSCSWPASGSELGRSSGCSLRLASCRRTHSRRRRPCEQRVACLCVRRGSHCEHHDWPHCQFLLLPCHHHRARVGSSCYR